jgi:anti-sigma factor ChrR (cupin superfamily)
MTSTNGPSDLREHRRLALEYLALDSVGALSASDDDRWVREHVASGCAICREATRRIAALFDELLLAAPPAVPPRELRARVLAAVRGSTAAESRPPAAASIQVWNRWTAPADPKFYTLAAGDDWQDTAIAGIAVRPLHVDEQHDTVTMLVRMAAGTAYPRHRHGGDEQCYVLQGDLEVEGRKLRAGDFQFAPGGSIHGIQSTVGGCLLFIISSRHDELLIA